MKGGDKVKRKNGKENRKLGRCSRCLKKAFLQNHHVFPQRFYGKSRDTILLCDECHKIIENILPLHRKLTKDTYLEIHEAFFHHLKNDIPVMIAF